MGLVEQFGLFLPLFGDAGVGIALFLVVGFGAYFMILRAERRERDSRR